MEALPKRRLCLVKIRTTVTTRTRVRNCPFGLEELNVIGNEPFDIVDLNPVDSKTWVTHISLLAFEGYNNILRELLNNIQLDDLLMDLAIETSRSPERTNTFSVLVILVREY